MYALLDRLSPRSSLRAGTVWLVIALAASFAVAASLLAGRAAREIVVQQHVRRLLVETEKLAANVAQSVDAHLDALRSTQAYSQRGERKGRGRIQPATRLASWRRGSPGDGRTRISSV